MKNLFTCLFLLCLCLFGNAQIAPYCNPVQPYPNADPNTEGGGWDIGIANVSIGTINNTTAVPTGIGGYLSCTGGDTFRVRNYTDTLIYGSAQLATCNSYNLNVTVGAYGCGGPYPSGIEAWIDWNGDGNFTGPGEYLGDQSGLLNGATGTLSFTVPGTAVPGLKRMRVYSDDEWATSIAPNPNTPCVNHYGEMEDYTINVIASPASAYVSSEAFTGAGTNMYSGGRNARILRLEVVTSPGCGALDATAFDFIANGTTNAADIERARLYYTGTVNTFSICDEYGSLPTPGAGTFTITGSQALAPGTNYFWLVYDLGPNAATGTYMDADFTRIELNSATSQVPTTTAPAGNHLVTGVTTFERRFIINNDHTYCNAVINRPGGGFAVVGSSPTPYLFQYDASLNMVSTTGYSGTVGATVIPTANGGYLLLGDDFSLVKTDINGGIEWETRLEGAYTGGRGDGGLIQDSNGDFVVTAGTQTAFTGGNRHVYVAKLSPTGVLLWAKTYAFGGVSQLGRSIIETQDGGYLVGGTEAFENLLMKIDANGVVQWHKTFVTSGTSNNEGVAEQTLCGSGYFYLGGYGDIHLIKTDLSGNLLWARRLNVGSNVWAYSIKESSDGGLLIGGQYNPAPWRGFAMKVDYDGNVVWAKQFNGPETQGSSILETPDGILFASWGWNMVAGRTGIRLNKLDRAGNSCAGSIVGVSNMPSGAFDNTPTSFTESAVSPMIFSGISTVPVTPTPGGGCTQLPLPVAMGEFTAVPVDNRIVDLGWRTLTEMNNEKFVLERSADGKAFAAFAEVAGAGNSMQTVDYAYTDAAPLPGRSFYRLKQVDFDGNSSYSEVREVVLTGEIGVSLFPNPVQPGSGVTLTVSGLGEAEVRVLVTDLLGRVIWKTGLIGGGEIKTLKIPTTGWSGIYLIEVRSDGDRWVRRLQIAN